MENREAENLIEKNEKESYDQFYKQFFIRTRRQKEYYVRKLLFMQNE